MAHLRGIPSYLRERFGVPVVFYDGDVPMSLPEFGGMDTGFNYYHGADPSEYDLVVSNSEGGLERLRELGARQAEAVFWGADPEFFAPQPLEKVHDVFFYGYGDKFRRDWMAAMVGEPSRAAPELEFALGGRDFQGDTGRAWLIGDVPFNTFARAISQARINLNITRRSHASVYASSSARPFELASSGPRSSRTLRGDRALVRAGPRAPRRARRGRGAGGVPGAAGRPGRGGGDGRAGARAGARRAHVRPPREAAARARRPRQARRGPCLSRAASRSSPPSRRSGDRGRRGGDPRRRPEARRRRRRRRLGDGTSAAAHAAGAAVVRLPFNLGIGGAVQTGFKYALEHGYEIAVRLDGDGQHDPTELPKLLAPVLAGEADIVIGSRFARRRRRLPAAARAPPRHRLLRARSSRCSSRQRVTDTTSGFQALNRKGIGLFAADYPHDYPEVEATVMVVRHRLRLLEVPVRMREREHGALLDHHAAFALLRRQGAARALRRALPPPRRAGGGTVTSLRVSIAAAIASILLILVVLELIRSRRLRERYALLWLVTGVVLLVLSVWRGGLNTIAAGSASRLSAGGALRGRRRSSSSSCCSTTRRCCRGSPTRTRSSRSGWRCSRPV